MGLIYLAMFFATAITNLVSPAPASNQPMQASANKDCTYENVSPNSAKVSNINFNIPSPNYPTPTLPYGPYGPAGYSTVYNKEWVLVKRDAPIPRYKVIEGAKNSSAGREMDVIGKVLTSSNIGSGNENGKWVFVALGHCEMRTTPRCIDPMTQDIVFVLQARGDDASPNPVYPAIEIDNITSASPMPSYWIFNVYVSRDMLVYNHQHSYGGSSNEDFSSDDLPCWLTQCLGGDLRPEIGDNFAVWNAPCQKGTPVPNFSGTVTPYPTPGLGTALAPGEDYPPSFINRDWIKVITPTPTGISGWGGLTKYMWFSGKTSGQGDVDYGEVKGKLGRKEVTFKVTLKKTGTARLQDIAVILKPEDRNIYYLYLPTSYSESGQGANLKLRTFKPSPGFVYDWWYPSCKPAVYLYPEKETLFDVSLKPFGILTKSEPSYPFFTGWKGVKAEPSGQLTYKDNQYDYLYYEGRSFFVKTPQSGFVIRGDELSGFFDAVLPDLGLNNKESADFKEYWRERLNDPEAFYQASILPQEEIERLEGMSISPKPETLIRLRFVFKKLNDWQLLPLPQLSENPQRKGITVVDWGGFFRN